MFKSFFRKVKFFLFDKVAQFVYTLREQKLLQVNEWLDERAARNSPDNIPDISGE